MRLALIAAINWVCVHTAEIIQKFYFFTISHSGVLRIFQWGVSVTSHRDDVKILHYNYSSLEVLKCIVL